MLLLFSTFLLPIIYAADPCQTPNGQKGECVPINQCKQLYSHFEDNTLTPEIETYLRRSHCGFVETYPKVCCPNGSSTPKTDELIATSDLLPTDCGLGTQNKIFGGQLAGLDEFPWMALLEFRSQRTGGTFFGCGGTLISKRYVLTAAHCLRPSLLKVHLGEYNIDTEIDCVNSTLGSDCAPKKIVVGIDERIIYESYKPTDKNRYHDIGLLRLDRDVEFSDFVKPICLPLKVSELYESYLAQNLTIAGWGFTESRRKSNILLKVQIPVQELAFCERAFVKLYQNITLDAGQICAGGVEGQDSCEGDSGGPLIGFKKEKSDIKSYLIGLVSFGPTDCGLKDTAGIYTKVAKYVKWIVDNMKP